MDELHKAVEVGKRPYQNILKVIISAGVTAMICFLIGVLMHLFLKLIKFKDILICRTIK